MRKGALVGVVLALGACAPLAPVDRAQQLVRQHREGEASSVLAAHLAKHPDDVPARRLYVRVLAFTGDVGSPGTELEFAL